MSEELKIVAEQYGISVEDADRVLTAFKENRVTIRRKYTDDRCGTCQNFDRTPCRASGYCTKRKRKTRYRGETDQPLPVTQSRLCCTDYLPKEGVVSGDSGPVAETSAESAL